MHEQWDDDFMVHTGCQRSIRGTPRDVTLTLPHFMYQVE
jgi:hypothetical protein